MQSKSEFQDSHLPGYTSKIVLRGRFITQFCIKLHGQTELDQWSKLMTTQSPVSGQDMAVWVTTTWQTAAWKILAVLFIELVDLES